MGVYMEITPLPLTNQEALANLEEAFIKALELSKVSSNYADFKALREAEYAYISFIEMYE